ncbi:MAG: cytochrome ubiquinol oxidase subunit I [Planctomycetaceae bacterium]|nr:cytochrome ubiquinol oxidase subunit I [Planctomycetaceae bacterium]
MHYPWWYVPGPTAPMLIAVVAVVHVLVAHYAVGGGILIAIENSHAIRKGDEKYRNYWKSHTQFFVLLTVAFGAITGVGIWWTIGLASPLATEMLIRTFVFGWAIEWVFFIVEIVAAFTVYYYWDRLPKNTHRIVAWIYAFCAWISLVLITGITAFMLNGKGLFGDWNPEAPNFWLAFFNVQFIPQTILRTGGCLLLSTLYVYVHAAWTLQNDSAMLEKVVRRMSRPLLAGIALLFLGVTLWFPNLPPAARQTLESAAVLNVFLGLLVVFGGVLVLLMYLGPVRNPKSMNLGFAVCLFFLGMTVLTVSEFVREAVRKPFIVDQFVYGNQIYASEVDNGKRSGGYLESGYWTEKFARTIYEKPQPEFYHPIDANGNLIVEEWFQYPVRLNQFEEENRFALGQALFMYHCNNCHALEHGYSAVAPMLVGESKEGIAMKIRSLNVPSFFMPPWCGTDAEADVLAEYLESVRPTDVNPNEPRT